MLEGKKRLLILNVFLKILIVIIYFKFFRGVQEIEELKKPLQIEWTDAKISV